MLFFYGFGNCMSSPADFTHVLKRVGNRLMIESTCTKCGAAGLVSHHDGTLAEWEERHACNDGKPESRPEADRKRDDST